MSPHRVLMILAAMLAVGAALTEVDPNKCWEELREVSLLRGRQFRVENNTHFVCKNAGFKIYYFKNFGSYKITHAHDRDGWVGHLKCYEDSTKKPYLINHSAKDHYHKDIGGGVFCAAADLGLCEEEAKRMYADNDVRMNDERTNFTCNSAGSIPYIKIGATSSPQVASKFLCVDTDGNGPSKIYAYPDIDPDLTYLTGDKVQLGLRSSIFCKGSESTTDNEPQTTEQPRTVPPTQQPESGPAPYQQQPGSNPALAQLQPCSCLCNPPHGHPVPQYHGNPQYVPAQPSGHGPIQKCLCYCQTPAVQGF